MAVHPTLGTYYLYVDGDASKLFCENETNVVRLYGQQVKGYFKDAFHDFIVNKNSAAVNPSQCGTKAGVLFSAEVASGQQAQFRLRLSAVQHDGPFADFDQVLTAAAKGRGRFLSESA